MKLVEGWRGIFVSTADNLISAVLFRYRTELLEFQNSVMTLGFGVLSILSSLGAVDSRLSHTKISGLGSGILLTLLSLGILICLNQNGKSGHTRMYLNFALGLVWVATSVLMAYHLPCTLVFTIPLALMSFLCFVRQASIQRGDW